MLDFRIETFLEVCRTMNFTKAAKRLHITQPAVSQHIRALERQYKTKLFAYAGKQLCLTEVGRMVLQTATTMHHDARRLQDAVAQLGVQPTDMLWGYADNWGIYYAGAAAPSAGA